jgi:hypothetical protein
MLGLLLAGLVVFVVGLLAIGFGVPVKEFSFGNTLIVTGALGACTGAVLIALSLVLRELKAISLALGPAGLQPSGYPREGLDAFSAQSAALAAAESGGLTSREAGAGSAAEQPAPWQDELAARPHPSDREAGIMAPPEVESPVKKRRNLLFVSSKRDRALAPSEPAHAEAETLAVAAQAPAPAPPAEPRVSFEEAWPASDRPRPDLLRRTTRPAGAPGTDEARAGAAAPPPVRRPAESPPVTILKSGVVDGMAYSLYSDGSIEAQMPEGMIRFASIDELRNHLDQRE